MKNLKIILSLVGISALVFLLTSKNMKNYILIGLISLVVGGVVGWFIHSPKPCETVYLPSEIQLRDTCIGSTLLCTLTTKDSLSIYKTIKEGIKSKVEKVVPKIENVTGTSIAEQEEPVYERTYTKVLDNGVVTVWDTLVVIGKIKDWNRAYKVNEVTQVKETHTTTTAVIEEESDDSETVKYLPITTPAKKETWVGAEGNIIWADKPRYLIGVDIQSGKTTFKFMKDPFTPFDRLEGYGFGLQRNIFKVSSK